MISFYRFCASLILLCLMFSSQAYAQFLPDNTSLNAQSVQRWMASNRELATVIQTLEGMYKSDEDMRKFETLPAAEQDQKISEFLQKKNILQSATALAGRYGWKSVGEYMRFSTRLGNAIAAYFFSQKTANLTQEQIKSVRAKEDSAVLSVPADDVAFVKSHEALLKTYIQAYSGGQ